MVINGGCIVYLRASTDQQGKSGLGIEAQREAVARYLNGQGGYVLKEIVEIESGRKADRPELDRALSAARSHRVPLVVAKIDRLTRSVSFLSQLLDSGVDVRFCDLPQVEGATGRFLLHQMASVAELEAGMISARTKAALVAAKARGTKLGGNRGTKPTRKAFEAGSAALTRLADERARDLQHELDEIRTAGITKHTGIARELTSRGIPTARGKTTWTATQVARVLGRHIA